MDLSLNSAGGRREERHPLGVLIELRGSSGEEMLEADGIDVSPGGISMRASFVPPLGARIACNFRCPPAGEPVHVEGEVVWAEWTGPRTGAFGMRFVELDTKSATAIRRYLEPEQPETPRVAATPRKFGAPCSPRIHSLRDFILIGPIGSTITPIEASRRPNSSFAIQACTMPGAFGAPRRCGTSTRR